MARSIRTPYYNKYVTVVIWNSCSEHEFLHIKNDIKNICYIPDMDLFYVADSDGTGIGYIYTYLIHNI